MLCSCQNLFTEVAKENNLPEGISCIVTGDYKVGEMMTTISVFLWFLQQDHQEWEELLAQQLQSVLVSPY